MTYNEFEFQKTSTVEKESHAIYRKSLISDIMLWAPGKWSKDVLEKKSTTTLERIHDYC